MVLNKEDFMALLKSRVGDDTSDEAMSFLENATDTYNDLESRTIGKSDAEWQKKYDENDAMWRQKYKERFFNTGTTKDEVLDNQNDDIKDDGKTVSFDDLFTEREG